MPRRVEFIQLQARHTPQPSTSASGEVLNGGRHGHVVHSDELQLKLLERCIGELREYPQRMAGVSSEQMFCQSFRRLPGLPWLLTHGETQPCHASGQPAECVERLLAGCHQSAAVAHGQLAHEVPYHMQRQLRVLKEAAVELVVHGDSREEIEKADKSR